MKILAIDTSSKKASVAILEDLNTLIELNNNDEKTHSQKLMPMIDEAFQKTNLSLDNIDLISCSLGPGSFTGVRIGIATAKAFVDSRNIPAVGITSLEGLAYNMNREGYFCSFINAGHGNVYAGFFHIVKKENSNYFQTMESDFAFLNLEDENGNFSSKSLLHFLQKNEKVKLTDNPIHFVGDASITYESLLEILNFDNNNLIVFAVPHQCEVSSISIAKIGYAKYKNGEYGNSSILSPIYLRKSQAELSLKKENEEILNGN